jgi:hypothetical protein
VTATESNLLTAVQPVTVDLYRDIHKGIRSELFTVTGTAGNVDPDDRAGRDALAARVAAMVELLVKHAEHEDMAVQPALEVHLPPLATKVASDHVRIEGRLEGLVSMALDAAAARPADARFELHRLYLELASFAGTYLEHQDFEERVVMPALEQAIGVEAASAIEHTIISSIPPQEMAASLAIMLPAMNLEDRVELLGGMQVGAPREVFEGIWGLAGTVLDDASHAALAVRLDLA